jgi:LEA14-like dessication related protein
VSRRLVLAVLVASLASGCALARLLTGSFERPKVRFDHVSLERLSLRSIDLGVHLEVDNPNDLELTLARIDYALAVEGKRVAAGTRDEEATLPALAKTVVEFPVKVDPRDLGPVAAEILRRRAFDYDVTGTAGLDTPIGVLEYPFRHEGRVKD